MEKIEDKVAKVRTLIVETASNYEVDIYNGTDKVVVSCRFSKQIYTLYEVHVLLSKLLI